jgi:hypothetical protein
MLMKKENWPELAALTSIFSVELPGIEPASLPGLLPSELLFCYVSFRFSPVRYLRFRFRVLTASRAVIAGVAACQPLPSVSAVSHATISPRM